jgi:hypothetical protein
MHANGPDPPLPTTPVPRCNMHHIGHSSIVQQFEMMKVSSVGQCYS